MPWTYSQSTGQIHGNNAANNASRGCIILPPAVRLQIGNSGDTVLNVVP